MRSAASARATAISCQASPARLFRRALRIFSSSARSDWRCTDLARKAISFPLSTLGVHRPAYPHIVAVDTDAGGVVKVAVAPYPLAYVCAQLSGHVPAAAYLYAALQHSPHASLGNRLVEHIEHPLVFNAAHSALP